MILLFLDHLEQARHNSIRTRNARLAAIHSFFHHVATKDPALMNLVARVISIEGKRTTKPLLGYLEKPDLDAILAACDEGTPQGRRDRTLLLFMVLPARYFFAVLPSCVSVARQLSGRRRRGMAALKWHWIDAWHQVRLLSDPSRAATEPDIKGDIIVVLLRVT